jgi:hypothetical protein
LLGDVGELRGGRGRTPGRIDHELPVDVEEGIVAEEVGPNAAIGQVQGYGSNLAAISGVGHDGERLRAAVDLEAEDAALAARLGVTDDIDGTRGIVGRGQVGRRRAVAAGQAFVAVAAIAVAGAVDETGGIVLESHTLGVVGVAAQARARQGGAIAAGKPLFGAQAGAALAVDIDGAGAAVVVAVGVAHGVAFIEDLADAALAIGVLAAVPEAAFAIALAAVEAGAEGGIGALFQATAVAGLGTFAVAVAIHGGAVAAGVVQQAGAAQAIVVAAAAGTGFTGLGEVVGDFAGQANLGAVGVDAAVAFVLRPRHRPQAE